MLQHFFEQDAIDDRMNLAVEVAIGASELLTHERRKGLIADGRVGRVTMASGTWDSGSAFEAWVLSYPPDASADAGMPFPGLVRRDR